MVALKTALVLVLSLASALTWELPAIPANRRAQYYVQHGDGGYKYGYDTGDGHSGVAVADSNNQVQGEYSYLDDAGQTVNLKYTAGHGGFVPVSSGGSVAVKSTGFGSRGGHSGVLPSPAAIDPHFDPNADASYNFLINTADYQRSEKADSKGNVQGQYSYSTPEGNHAISYIAGEGLGFVVTGQTAPTAAAAPVAPQRSFQPPVVSHAGAHQYDGNTQVNQDGSFAFSYSTPAHGHQAHADRQGNVKGSYSYVADDGISRQVDYTAGANQGFVAKGAHLPSVGTASSHTHHSDGVYQYAAPSDFHGNDANTDGSYSYAAPSDFHGNDANTDGSYSYAAPSDFHGNDANADGSYSYSYDAGNSVKEEVSDAQGNVKGSFSYIAGDGVPRKLSYTARKNEGFVVSGDHLPVAPTAPVASTGLTLPNAFAHPDLFSTSSSLGAASTGSVVASKPGEYSYAYTTGGKTAASKSISNIFSAAPKTSYIPPVSGSNSHGSATGHVTAVKDGEYSYSYSTGGQTGGAAYKSANTYGSQIGTSYSSPATRSGSGAATSGQVMASKDGAYSYSYSTGGQTGAAVNSGAGFKTTQGQGSGLSGLYSSPSVKSASHGAAAGHVTASKDGAYSYSYSTGGSGGSAGHGTFGSGAVKPYSGSRSGQTGADQQGDGSYSFSYDAGTHSHQQSSDPGNNVRGRFSYQAKDDGQVRQVEYSAGAGTGFVARGAHLPGNTAGSRQSVQARQGGYREAAPIYEEPDEGGDASYSYSYDAGTSSKQETSDAQGNVMGTFSYVDADGVNRKLSYTAQKEAGFKAVGAHLPEASSGGSGGKYGTRTSVAQSRSTVHSSRNTSKYVPPAHSQKFGYVYDTKA